MICRCSKSQDDIKWLPISIFETLNLLFYTPMGALSSFPSPLVCLPALPHRASVFRHQWPQRDPSGGHSKKDQPALEPLWHSKKNIPLLVSMRFYEYDCRPLRKRWEARLKQTKSLDPRDSEKWGNASACKICVHKHKYTVRYSKSIRIHF